MGKDSALGHDPLRWMKITKENTKSLSAEDAGTKGQNAETAGQPEATPSASKQQTHVSPGNSEVRSEPKNVAPPGIGDMPANPAVPKPRVVIGRLYEKPSPDKGKSVPRNENEGQEARRSVEPSFPASRTMPPIKKMETEINRSPVFATASNFSTYIIIAYTVFLLVLGYFVYSDLSKRTTRLEAKILAIEKILREE